MILIPLDDDTYSDLPRLNIDELEEQIAAYLRAAGGDVSGLGYSDASGEWVSYSAPLHRWQDNLMIVALQSIAAGAAAPARLASLALRTLEPDYSRWYE